VRRALLLCLFALVPVACGEEERDEAALLSATEARELDQRVARIGELAAEGRCTAARENLGNYAFLVEELPERRDPEVRAQLRDGAGELERTIAAECARPESAATTEATTAPETTESVPEPEPTVTEEVPVEPEPEPEPAPTGEVPAPEAPGEDGEGGAGDEGVPPGQGGTPPGQGGTPPGQVAPDASGGAQAPGDDG